MRHTLFRIGLNSSTPLNVRPSLVPGYAFAPLPGSILEPSHWWILRLWNRFQTVPCPRAGIASGLLTAAQAICHRSIFEALLIIVLFSNSRMAGGGLLLTLRGTSALAFNP